MATNSRRLAKSPRFVRAGLVFLGLLVTFSSAKAEWTCLPDAPTCKSVYILHDTWHAAIVLRAGDISPDTLPELGDFPEAEFVEFSWGDKDYFPDPHAGVFAALRAAFWSNGSVLHVVGFRGDLKTFYRGAAMTEVRLAPASFDRLTNFISQAFSRPDTRGRSQPSPGLFAHSRFYPSTHRFSVFRTCNTWVAEALESAGLPVSPRQVFTAANLETQMAGLGESK